MGAFARTDEELAAAAGSGDDGAFAEIYERFSTPLYDFAWRLLRNQADAGDVVQVTMERAWRNLASRRPDARLKSWLFTIAHNAAMDVVRRRKPVDPIDDERDDGYAVPSQDTDPGAGMEAQELADDVWAAAAALSATEYAALHHELRGELSPDEIAVVMGMQRGAVYTALSRAKASFEEAFTILQLGRHGRDDCAELDAIVGPRSLSELDRRTRRAIRAHVTDCEVCTANSRRFVAPGALFSTLPPILAPEGLVDIVSIVQGEGSIGARPRGRLRNPTRSSVWALGAVAAIALAAIGTAVLSTSGVEDRDPTASTADSADSTAPIDPTDVASTSHAVGERSADPIVVMVWSPGKDPATDGEEPSGLAGYSHSWTRRAGSVPPGQPTLDAAATGTESLALDEGSWWFHLRTFDRAGNSTRTVHAGPFKIVSSPRVTCTGSSTHPYWQQNPVRLVLGSLDGGVRIRVASTPEALSFLREAAGDGQLALNGEVDGERRSLRLKPSGGSIRRDIEADRVEPSELTEASTPFAAFEGCAYP